MTDKALEAAARAMHDGPLGADDEVFDSSKGNSAAEWCVEMAEAAITAYENEAWSCIKENYTGRVQGVSERSSAALRARHLLGTAHIACFKAKDRDILGMSNGPFSGVNEVLGLIASMDAEIERLKTLSQPPEEKQ